MYKPSQKNPACINQCTTKSILLCPNPTEWWSQYEAVCRPFKTSARQKSSQRAELEVGPSDESPKHIRRPRLVSSPIISKSTKKDLLKSAYVEIKHILYKKKRKRAFQLQVHPRPSCTWTRLSNCNHHIIRTTNSRVASTQHFPWAVL